MSNIYQLDPKNQANDPFSLAAHVFPVTFFPDKFATTQRREMLTLEMLAELIQTETAPKKIRLPWLKMALFGDVLSPQKCLRTNANMLAISGIEAEHDAGTVTFEAAVTTMRAADIRCLVYTSPSYAPGEKEKWRILAPLSETSPPEMGSFQAARLRFTARVNGVLGGVLAPESFNRSQAYLYGSVNRNPAHRAEIIDGYYFIDGCDDLDAGAIGKPIAPRSARINQPADAGVAWGRDEGEIRGLLEKSQITGEWHNAMLSVTATMVGAGWSDEQIELVCKPYAPDGMADVWALVKSAREKWGAPDPGTDWSTTLGPALKAAGQIAGAAVPPAAPNWRERRASGAPVASLHNALLAIETVGLQCSHDTFHNRFYIGRDDAAPVTERLLGFIGEVTDASILALRVWLSVRYGFDLTEPFVRGAVLALCGENAFNPVIDMLAEAQASWDGVPRLDRMAVEYFNCEDTELNRQCVRKTMVAAVARARHPGIKFDNILVMESPQGWNKSSAWRVLAGDDNFSDEAIIGKATREVQENLAGIWIHENAELAGMRKAEIDTVTAFASRQVDRARPAYGRFLVAQPRHSIEVGTTNADRYLQSQVGNRRFWPVKVLASIDLAKLKAARLQLWGEAAECEARGESLVLDPALWGAAGAEQDQRRVVDPWEAILAGLTAAAPHAGPIAGIGAIGNGIVHKVADEDRVATAVIFEHVLRIPAGQLHQMHMKRLADCMRALGWKNAIFLLDGKTTRGYARKITGDV